MRFDIVGAEPVEDDDEHAGDDHEDPEDDPADTCGDDQDDFEIEHPDETLEAAE